MMKNLVKLIEIPVTDFNRAVKFYEAIMAIKLTVCDSCETEKMAFFWNRRLSAGCCRRITRFLFAEIEKKREGGKSRGDRSRRGVGRRV